MTLKRIFRLGVAGTITWVLAVYTYVAIFQPFGSFDNHLGQTFALAFFPPFIALVGTFLFRWAFRPN